MQTRANTTLPGPRALALVAAVYPALSETFVYREAVGLAARGWQVRTVSLHPLGAERRAEHVQPASLAISGPHTSRTLAAAGLELLTHPLQSLWTVWKALCDALVPGEPTSLAGRFRVLGLGVLALGLARALRGWGVSHVHCHFANGPTTLGMYAALHLDLPFSFVGHANDLFDRRSLLRRKLERAAFVSCISEWHRSWYRELCPSRAERYQLIRCGVDVESWRPCRPRQSGEVLRVLCVARLIPKKGVDTLLRALARARKQHGLAVELRIAGDGPQRATLEALAAELELESSVQFLGAVPNEEVAALMSAADVFVLACRTDRLGDRDGIPVVLMEAMAAELPVIVGDLPTIRELVRDGETGLLVAGDDVAALADRLVALAPCPDERARLGAAGRRAVAAEFALAPNLDRLEQALLGRTAEEAIAKLRLESVG